MICSGIWPILKARKVNAAASSKETVAWIFLGISAMTKAESHGVARSARNKLGTGMR